ncbi:hypothetical protein D3C86_1208660 [compost metagenome]
MDGVGDPDGRRRVFAGGRHHHPFAPHDGAGCLSGMGLARSLYRVCPVVGHLAVDTPEAGRVARIQEDEGGRAGVEVAAGGDFWRVEERPPDPDRRAMHSAGASRAVVHRPVLLAVLPDQGLEGRDADSELHADHRDIADGAAVHRLCEPV